MIVNTGLNVFRDACKDQCSNGEAGTDSTAPAEGQTDLQAGVAATNASLTVITSFASFQTSHFISSATATGNNFKEWKVETSGGTMISRAVTAGVNHTSTDEITKTTTFNLVNR